MSDNDSIVRKKDSVQREIEENQRRARPKSEVGMEEDVLVGEENADESRSIVDDIGDVIRGKDENETHDNE